MAKFPIDESYLIAAPVEGALWGVYLATFICCMYTTISHKRELKSVPIIAACVMFVLATAHWSLALSRLIHGFIDISDPIQRKIFFAFVGAHVNVAKDFLYITNMVIGDLILVWRLYIIWGRNKYIIIAPLLMVATSALGFGGVINWLTPNPLDRAQLMLDFGTIMFSTSLALNIIVTALIAGKIWWTSRQLDSFTSGGTHRKNKFKPVILIMVESGFLISAAKLTEFTLFKTAPVSALTGNHGLYVVYESMPQIQGIVPLLILIAVSLGLTQNDSTYMNAGSALPSMQFTSKAHTNQTYSGSGGSRTRLGSSAKDVTSDLFHLPAHKSVSDMGHEEWAMRSLSSDKA